MAIRLETGLLVTIAGDGSTTTVTVDLRQPPVNLNISGN